MTKKLVKILGCQPGAFWGPGGLVPKLCLTLATPWTVALQAPQSVGFFRRKYWSGLPFPPPGDLLDPGIEPRSLALQADSFWAELSGKPLWWPRGVEWGKGREAPEGGDIYMCVCALVCVYIKNIYIYMCMYDWFMSLYSRNQHSAVKKFFSN